MTSGPAEPRPAPRAPTLAGNMALGFTQIVLWGGSFFLMAVVVDPIVGSTGWPQGVVVSALSLAILVSGLCSPWVGRRIRRHGGRPVLIAGTLTLALGQVEPPRVSRRLQLLRGWSHDEANPTVFS